VHGCTIRIDVNGITLSAKGSTISLDASGIKINGARVDINAVGLVDIKAALVKINS
jgi:hypothetical protein